MTAEVSESMNLIGNYRVAKKLNLGRIQVAVSQ